MENRFYRWRGIDAAPTRIVPAELLPQLPPTDVRYFVRIFDHLDHLLPEAGLTFFLTWHLDDFHEAMEDAVIILVGDERNQTPAYQGKVRALFKVCGIRGSPIRETLRLPASIAWRILLREARNGALRIQRRLRYGIPRHVATPMYEIPTGPFALVDIAPPPIDERPVDVFFAGGSTLGWSLRTRTLARKRMAAAVATAQTALPQYRIGSLLGADRQRSDRLGPEAYTQSLANAKIALAPRGNYDAESYRVYEAAKLGCVIISEPLPSRWYFQGCPAVTIREWSALPEVLSRLLNDPAMLRQLSLRTRQWWDSTVSEAAIAKFVAQKLVASAPPPRI
jgi:hypothetical protein